MVHKEKFWARKIEKQVHPNSSDDAASVRLDATLDIAASKQNATYARMPDIANRPLVCLQRQPVVKHLLKWGTQP